ncbi:MULTISPECIES: hypothetical protein [unclassified Paenibacillus]|nr:MULTISPECIES: hypothetical protein [unclassified Paenibacillus]
MREYVQSGSIDLASLRYVMLLTDGLLLPRSDQEAGRRPDDKLACC